MDYTMQLVNFFEFVAEEIRELLAHLGYKKLDDVIGRADLLKSSEAQNNRVEKTKGVNVEKFIKDNTGEAVVTLPIKNTDRSTGAMLAGNIARAHGNRDFKGQINVQFEGSAGQSFGAFTLPGLSLRLVG